MPAPEIVLDEQHVYHVGLEIWPGVNQILTETGLMRPYLGDPWYGERGTAVHLACHLLDRDELDPDSVDPQIAGFMEGYRKFKKETGWMFQFSEERLAHPFYRYCGTPDRWDMKCGLLDLKTGDTHDPLTLELYAELIKSNGHAVPRQAYFLRLKEDGTYTLKPYTLNPTTRSLALSAVLVWWGRKRRGTL